MTDITERLAAIEARVEAATEGPWGTYAAYGSRGVEVVDTEDMVFIQDGGVTYAVHEPDAEFIAHARTDVPWLVEQVRELRAERDTYRERWRQLMRDHEAVDKERDELEAENERLQAENERLLDDLKQERRSHRGAHDAGVAILAERDAAREQVRQRDEVIERVRAALAGHPECDRYPNDGGEPILCGWKRAVVDVRAALEGGGR